MMEKLIKVAQRARRRIEQDGVGGLFRRIPVFLEHQFMMLRPEYREEIKAERDFDRSLGTETSSWVTVDQMGFDDPSVYQAPHDHYYEPTSAWLFNRMMTRLDALDPGHRPERYTFMDVGSGKGRPVIQAARRGYARVIGVELAESLHAVAKENLERWRRADQVSDERFAQVELRNEDALTTEIPQGPLVLFLYNPFHAPMLETLLRRVNDARPGGDPCWVLYVYPKYHRVLDAEPWLTEIERHKRYRIYHNT